MFAYPRNVKIVVAKFPSHNCCFSRFKSFQFPQDDVGRLRIGVEVEFRHACSIADGLHAPSHDVDMFDLRKEVRIELRA